MPDSERNSESICKCETCGALLDEEDLFCANCGTEAARDASRPPAPESAITTHNFTCRGCGASMSYDASAQTLRCPFCGSTSLAKQPDQRVLAADGVVPFVVDREQAIGLLRAWLGKGFWRPGDLSERATIVEMTPVYVPYWVFAATLHTYWTADSSDVPFTARGDWRPIFGEHHGHCDGLLVGASGGLTAGETRSLCPFDLGQALPRDQVDLDNVTVEPFRVTRKYARPLARGGLQQLQTDACRQYVPGECRNLQVNLRLEDLQSTPMLLPVWMLAYRYRGQPFRFLINGQTGRATGQAPLSWKKPLAIAAIVMVVAALAMLFALR